MSNGAQKYLAIEERKRRRILDYVTEIVRNSRVRLGLTAEGKLQDYRVKQQSHLSLLERLALCKATICILVTSYFMSRMRVTPNKTYFKPMMLLPPSSENERTELTGACPSKPDCFFLFVSMHCLF